jgi:phage-related protein
MVETGNVAGAQKIMLDELSKEFGGSAAAAVDTYAGQQIILKEQMAGIQQTLGEALMPLLMQFGLFMSDTVVPIIADVVGGFSDWITSMNDTGTASSVLDTIRNAIAAVPGVLAQMSAGLAVVQTFLQPLTDAIMAFAAVAIPAITSAGAAIAEYLASPQVAAYIQTLSTFFTQLATTIRDILVLAFQALTVVWQGFVSAFTTMWPYIQTVLDSFQSAATIVINFVTGLLTALSQLVKGDFSGAWTTLKTTVGNALSDLWGFFLNLKKNLTTFFDEVKPEVIKLGTAMVQGIADGIKSGASWIKDALLQAARDAWSAVTSWFSGQGADSGGDGGDGGGGGNQGRAVRLGGASANTNGVVYNLTMHASYANSQSDSTLINDARAWMMTLGAE